MKAFIFDSSKIMLLYSHGIASSIQISRLTACKAIVIREWTLFICASVLPTYIRCDLYQPACVKTKAQTIVITGKNVLQKSLETEKKVQLSVGLNPQLRRLTTVCLRGLDRNAQQLNYSLPFLYTSAFNAL